ncbi:hypothetical protein ACQ5SO_07225 [Rhodovulum sp. DZ06]|uniref:hypothetical protein n=1 Tax=Rhodovulum sp. DZ06 TaxID=3425126 RepID=UPI003D346BB7
MGRRFHNAARALAGLGALALLSACAEPSEALRMDEPQRREAAEVMSGGQLWRVAWTGSFDATDVYAAPASQRGGDKLLYGDLGADMAGQLGANAPEMGGPEAAAAAEAVMAAQGERPICARKLYWFKWGAPSPAGTLVLTEPRFDPVQGIWIFKGRCNTAAEDV